MSKGHQGGIRLWKRLQSIATRQPDDGNLPACPTADVQCCEASANVKRCCVAKMNQNHREGIDGA